MNLSRLIQFSNFRPFWQLPHAAPYLDPQPPSDETIAAIQRLRQEMETRCATRKSHLLTLELSGLIDMYGFDAVLQRLHHMGATMKSPGTSTDPRR